VINGQTNQIVTNISVGESPVYAAVNASTNMIYVAGGQTNQYIAVINGSSNTVTATVPVYVGGPMAVNAASNLVYFVNGGTELSVFDATSNQVTQTVTITKGCCLRTVAYSAATNNIYSYVAPNGLLIVDAITLKFTTVQFAQIEQLDGLSPDSTSNRVYLSDAGQTAVYVVNGQTGRLTNQILTGLGYAGPLAVNPTNHLVADFTYTVQSQSPFLSFISARSYGLVGSQVTFPANSEPYTLTAGANNRYYVTFYQHDGVAVVSGPQISGRVSGRVSLKR
jgi:DNA-binding beta-propeller fold protein YncE